MSLQTQIQTQIQTQTQTKKPRGRKPKNTTENIHKKLVETVKKNADNDEGANKTQHEIEIDEPEIQIQTFHFGFSEDIAQRFTYFATLHRYDDRKSFKESWGKWILVPDVAQAIAQETATLEEQGYQGDILDKMFKSVRYYYRKKPAVPKEPKQRKAYVSLSTDILEKIDKHVVDTIVQHTDPETNVCDISPAKAFDEYRKTIVDQQIDLAKYKKTYKNRFFIVSRNIRALYDK
jgi:hypothetical protein